MMRSFESVFSSLVREMKKNCQIMAREILFFPRETLDYSSEKKNDKSAQKPSLVPQKPSRRNRGQSTRDHYGIYHLTESMWQFVRAAVRAAVPSAAVAAQGLPTDVPTDVQDSAFTRVREQDVHVETTVPQLPKPVTSGARSGARPWAGVNYFPLER
jgi:hypothetical protein